MSEELQQATTNDLARLKREELEKKLETESNIWGFSPLGIEGKKAAMAMLSTKHGLYANIPIVCKSEYCPYNASCKLLKYDLAPLGESCPIEVVQIEERLKGYSEDFELENASFTDNIIINELIQTDIMLERCKQLIQVEAMPIQDIVINITENGDAITQPQVSKTIELNERLSKKRNELLSLMKATRKDKKEDVGVTQSFIDIIAEALAKEEKQEFVIDVKPENIE